MSEPGFLVARGRAGAGGRRVPCLPGRRPKGIIRAGVGGRTPAVRLAPPLVLLALAACATLGLPELNPLQFSEAPDRSSTLRYELPGAGRPAGAAAIRLWARVENPNTFRLTLSEIEGRLHVEEVEGPRVHFPLGLPLEAEQDTVIPLDVSVGLADLPDLAAAIRSAIGRGAAGYRLEGTFAVDAGRLGTPRFGPLTLLQGEVRAVR